MGPCQSHRINVCSTAHNVLLSVAHSAGLHKTGSSHPHVRHLCALAEKTCSETVAAEISRTLSYVVGLLSVPRSSAPCRSPLIALPPKSGPCLHLHFLCHSLHPVCSGHRGFLTFKHGSNLLPQGHGRGRFTSLKYFLLRPPWHLSPSSQSPSNATWSQRLSLTVRVRQ